MWHRLKLLKPCYYASGQPIVEQWRAITVASVVEPEVPEVVHVAPRLPRKGELSTSICILAFLYHPAVIVVSIISSAP